MKESNGAKTKVSSSGTSLAFQRAKEHSNRSSGVKVMVETVKLRRLKLGGAEVSLGRPVVPVEMLSGSTASATGSTAGVGKILRIGSGRNMGGNG